MKVVVIGSNGMLGHAVVDELQLRGHEVFRTTRNGSNGSIKLDATRPLHDVELPRADFVINCAGCINQRSFDLNEMYAVNAMFPHVLSSWCHSRGTKMIHVTTDCVFSGRKGSPYDEHDKPDVDDSYGISKSIGETNCMVLRTSLVGLELGSSFSLLGWVMSKHGQRVQGYTNHLWNGITNVQFGRVCDRIIGDGMHENVKRHVFSPEILSKHDMLVKFNERFDLKLDIEPIDVVPAVNRTLKSCYDLNDRLDVPSFDEQLKRL